MNWQRSLLQLLLLLLLLLLLHFFLLSNKNLSLAKADGLFLYSKQT